MDLDPQLPAHAPYAAYVRDTDRPLRVLGLVAVITAALVGLEWLVVGIGVGLSSGPDPSPSLRRLWTLWHCTGGSLAAALGLGLVSIVAAERRRAPRVRALLAVLTGVAPVLAIVLGTVLWTSSTG